MLRRLLLAGLDTMSISWIVALFLGISVLEIRWTHHPDRIPVVAVIEGGAVSGVRHQTVGALADGRITPREVLRLDILVTAGDLAVGQVRPVTPVGCFIPDQTFGTRHLDSDATSTAEVGMAVPRVGLQIEPFAAVHVASRIIISLLGSSFLRNS